MRKIKNLVGIILMILGITCLTACDTESFDYTIYEITYRSSDWTTDYISVVQVREENYKWVEVYGKVVLEITPEYQCSSVLWYNWDIGRYVFEYMVGDDVQEITILTWYEDSDYTFTVPYDNVINIVGPFISARYYSAEEARQAYVSSLQ